MTDTNLFSLLIVSSFVAYFLALRKARSWQFSENKVSLHSLPTYHGYLSAITTALPALIVLFLWMFLESSIVSAKIVSSYSELTSMNEQSVSLALNEIRQLAVTGLGNQDPSSFYHLAAKQYNELYDQSNDLRSISVIALLVIGFLITYLRIKPDSRTRNSVEKFVTYFLLTCALIAIVTTVGIVFSVLIESIEFFKRVNFFEFVLGTHWSPQIAIRADQVSSSGAFGAIPIFWGTIFISFISMLVAGPLGLISAIYLSEYANKKVRAVLKPILEILAGIPTVVYGFFAALTVGPYIRDFGNWLKQFGLDFQIQIFENFTVSSESALAAGLVMGMMIIPFILSLSDDVISAVPDAMRDGSTALGATRSETIWKVLVPAALPGIVGGFLLAISRAIGETMIVLMAAGVAANLTANPFNSVTTVTTQIVTLLTGDQEFDSAKTLAAFALGLGLFVTTLLLNIVALHITRKYREQYE